MSLKRLLIVLISGSIFIALVFPGCSDDDDDSDPANSPGQASQKSTPRFTRSAFMTGLDEPWDMVFAPDGTLFFTEKCRGLSVRKRDGNIVRLFGTSGSALTAADLLCEGQSGMMGVELDPQFASNRHIYVFMSSTLSEPATNRIIRLTVSQDFSSVSNRTDLIDDLAFKNNRNSWGGAGSHSGGRLRFGPDGFLYITTGDNHNGIIPQNLNLMGGKVLRVNRDGSPAPGNQTPTGGDARIFTYGHRNVQGLTFHPSTGQPYICEHGPGHSDEVTALTPGGNGGWDPAPAAGVTCADNYCGYISNRPDGRPTSMTDLEKFPNAMKPIYVWEDSQGVSPCHFVEGSQWQNWEGALIVGVMAAQRVDVLMIDPNGAVLQVERANLPNERARSFAQTLNGDIFIATDGGRIWKLSAASDQQDNTTAPNSESNTEENSSEDGDSSPIPLPVPDYLPDPNPELLPEEPEPAPASINSPSDEDEVTIFLTSLF